jgi:MEDS: MEthanogen/methylotroph, DcmR Sensory domain
MTQSLVNCHVDDAFDQISQTEYGVHYMLIYPNLATLRMLYSNYTHKQIEDNNEIVLINPFYETEDSVRQVLSQSNNYDTMDYVYKYEREKTLMIIDSLYEYFERQQPDDVSFKNGLADYAKQIGKNGLSILADMGAYPHRSKYNELLDHELSLPTKFDIAMKGFCLYHQKDFDKLSEQQKQKLIEHHGKAIKIIETQ